jgi:hypothetical protein
MHKTTEEREEEKRERTGYEGGKRWKNLAQVVNPWQ